MPNQVSAIPAEDLIAFALLYGTMANHLLDEAEHHVKHETSSGLPAIAASLANPLDSLNQITRLIAGPDVRMNAATLKNARRESRQLQNAINRRIRATGIEPPSAKKAKTDAEGREQSIDVLSGFLTSLAADAAMGALAERVLDESFPLERRWGFLLAMNRARDIAHEGVSDTSRIPAALEESPRDDDLSWMRIKSQFLKLYENIPEIPPVASAVRSLCADSGIAHTSDGAIAHPEAVRFMVLNSNSENEWTLGAWLFNPEAGFGWEAHGSPFNDTDYDLLDLMMFNHQGETHIKLIQEPFPVGYSSSLVKGQMTSLLETLRELFEDDEDRCARYRAAADAMYEAAARDLHTVSQGKMTSFLNRMRRTLDDPAVADYLFRSLTGHDPTLAALLTPPELEPPALAEPRQADALLDAGQASGMDDAKLWELALLLGVDPDDYDIPPFAINMRAFEELEQANKDWGIPTVAFERWNRLLDIVEDEHEDYGDDDYDDSDE